MEVDQNWKNQFFGWWLLAIYIWLINVSISLKIPAPV